MSLRCLLFVVLSVPLVTARTPWVQYDSAYVGHRPSNGWSGSDSASQLLRRLFAVMHVREPEIVRVRRIFGTELHTSWDPWSDPARSIAEWQRWNGRKRSAVDIPDTYNTGSDVVDRSSDKAVHYDFAARKTGLARVKRIFGADLHASWDHWDGRRKRRTANISAGRGVNTKGKKVVSDTTDKKRLLLRAIEANKVHVHQAALHRFQVASLAKYVENESGQQDKRHLGSIMRNGGPWRGHNSVKSNEHDRVIEI